MKCPQCQRNVRRGKEGMRCPGCGYGFVLDPKAASNGRVTDNKVLVAARRASDQGTYYFTPNQLYGKLYRWRWRRRWVQAGGALSVLVVIGTMVILFWGVTGPQRYLVIVGIVGIIILAVLWPLFAGPTMPGFKKVMKAVDRMANIEPMDRLVTEPVLAEPPPEWSEPDIYDYGVERLLIVERDVLVDLLVLNDFHAEQRALVIAESGYPDYLLPVAHRALQERPDLPVFLLHDLETNENEGRMLARLRGADSRFPIGDHPVTDLGLSAVDVRERRWLRRATAKGGWKRTPIDLVPQRRLSLALGAAIASGMSLAALAAAQRESGVEVGHVTHYG